MKRLFWLAWLVLVAVGVSGCANDAGARAQWQEALKDARGDNMQMGSRPAVKGLYD